MKNKLLLTTLAAGFLASAASAQTIINLNFRTFDATDPDFVNYGGSAWNILDSGDFANGSTVQDTTIYNSLGAQVPGVVFESVTPLNYMTQDATGTTWGTGPTDASLSWVPNDANVYDSAWKGLSGSSSGTLSLSVSGLGLGSQWTVRMLSAVDGNAFEDMNITVEGNTVSNFDSNANNDAGPATAVGLSWANLTLADGILNFDFTAQNSERFAGINAIQLEQVPEPSAAAFLFGGAALLAMFRRRR